MYLFSLSIVHGLCNGLLLQLIECIESIKNDVKRKMMLQSLAIHVRKSPCDMTIGKFFMQCFINRAPHRDLSLCSCGAAQVRAWHDRESKSRRHASHALARTSGELHFFLWPHIYN